MSVIAIQGIPMKWSLFDLSHKLKNNIKGPYEPLNFQNKKNHKVCYIRLSDKLDPVQVVESINSREFYFLKNSKTPFKAFIPNNVPDLPLAKSSKAKKFKMRGIPENLKPYEMALLVHGEILTELQSKYPQLYHLNGKTNKKLINEIAKIIAERIKSIVEAHAEATENCWRLSMFYRRTHPHFGDFQLILSTLHKLQDAAGVPRMQIAEHELAKFEPQPYAIGDVPFNQITKYCSAYSQRVVKAIQKHVEGWDTQPQDSGDENLARTKVRQEIKNLMPYMPTIMSQLTAKHFKPEETPYQRVRIYGEPFLPNKALIHPFINKYSGGSRIMRSFRMFNLIKFKVTQKNFEALLAMDGTTILISIPKNILPSHSKTRQNAVQNTGPVETDGAKLVIRNDMPIEQPSAEFRAEFAAALGAPPDAQTNFTEEPHSEEEDDDMDIDA